MSQDPTSQSNHLELESVHIDFEWTIDYERQLISGEAQHTLLVKSDNVKEAIFDTTALDVKSAEVEGIPASFSSKPSHPVMGSALHISLSAPPQKGSVIKVKILYTTTEGCTALQWLDKEQTQGKQHPYLFSQCQPIYMRSLAPVQDTPSIKTTYSARVSSVLPVLMSAIRTSPPADGPPHDGKVIGKDTVTYTYNQPVPIPSYLIAIAAGNVVYKPFPTVKGKTWKSGIWAEPELIDAAYWEFSEDTGRFLALEETVVPPYRFGVYDLLVLPPSFPYGGMENACLTFLTPTLLTGDRSLVDVVVHELTHSWFGNGVTHANASHFWLNEGFTTYMERLLQGKLHSPAQRGFSYVIGYKDLEDALQSYKGRSKYQRLVIDFETGEDPDDAYSSVPYEKGANFLLHLEQKLGGQEVFLPYIYDYVNTFTGKSITTEQWKDHLFSFYQKHDPSKVETLNTVKFDAWLYGEGLNLPDEIKYDTTLVEVALNLAARWDKARDTSNPKSLFSPADVKDFESNQKVVFLQTLRTYPPLPSTHINAIAELYDVSTAPNSEIRLQFYEVSLSDPQSDAAKKYAPAALKWVVGEEGGSLKGRMKFCRPTFLRASKVDHELAVKTFKAYADAFHPIARKLIEKDLGIA
ncbi:peptidase family M1-domain-containing protein [Irpex rosettiformis]|uniref:Peptidase family M1-domain-containing protein n=1 Tax=Irpex rosettiformis TaxID=378272 RepID=A0ACB8U6E6_9APHY|nr:peptidase family M1-domain-containing protein [Irpex rosettiformis]